MGNRIYGCDDCQLICPWNRFSKIETLPDFLPRNQLDASTLLNLFAWSEPQFLALLEGSPIRRIGHERWLRNIAVALGNGRRTDSAVAALRSREHDGSVLVAEHVAWALERLGAGPTSAGAAPARAVLSGPTTARTEAPPPKPGS
jgi:epoxyqueuosine reductase